ncbi:ParA family protein [Ornithinimicrobium cerasi]|uniref:ParA family protein n=1 Tax=Ornithinimicrobium cerasi TaxID=2248773 RepID=UPI002351249A|nr:ParA family protein [Ornithinimicrobium cerasi]
MTTPPHRALGWPEHGGLRVASDEDLLEDHGGLGWPGAHRPPLSVPRETSVPGKGARDGKVSRETSTPAPESRETAPVPRETPLPAPSVGWSGTRVLTVANQKGGVGKTTTAVNIAASMARAGLRVLVIDMDPQGNASTALSIPHLSGTAGIYDVLIDGVPMSDVVRETPQVPGLWCVPATIDLAGAEIELVPLVARENRLRRALTAFLDSRAPDEQFDMVLIDCPPSLGLLTVNAFVAAREVLIPIQCEYYALEGLSQLLKNVELIQQHLNSDLEVSTILLTMFDARTRLASDVADQVREHFGEKVLRVVIPRSVRISEAPSHGETVITYDPASSGALSYMEAAAQMRQQEVLV